MQCTPSVQGVLSKLGAAKELMKEILAREKKKAAEREAEGKEQKTEDAPREVTTNRSFNSKARQSRETWRWASQDVE